MGKSVSIVVEELHYTSLYRVVKKLGLSSKFRVVLFPPDSAPERQQRFVEETSRCTDHIIAIERAGPAADGRCRSMRGIDRSKHVAAVHKLVERALYDKDSTGARRTIVTAIGDGGNEMGMGKVLRQIRTHIPLGPEIGCVISCDFLIAAGVSNWGGYALLFALYALAPPGVRSRRQFHALPSHDTETQSCKRLNEEGVADGVTGSTTDPTVDGLSLDVNLAVLDALRSAVGLASS